MTPTTYRTLAAPAEGQFKDKGSRFTAYAYPVSHENQVKQHVEALRQQHHKARHWCYAYRIGTDGNRFRANDDGEPSGSAGRPILGQIDSFDLTDTLVVVVRYFGGTLLGVPGLIHAYKTATANALSHAEIIEKNIEQTIALRCAYPVLGEVRRLAKLHQAQIIEQDLQLDCRLLLRVPLAQLHACTEAWRKTESVNLEE